MRIGVIGGGVAGLLLARVLHRRGAPVHVYERDSGLETRDQGGSLDLHPESGQRALAAAGLIREFRRHARPAGQQIRIVDPAGHLHVDHDSEPAPAVDLDSHEVVAGRPEIDRDQLRRLLVASMPASTIAWGHHLLTASPTTGGGWELHFDGGRSTICDVLVGADGARSRVRPLLTDVEPVDTGITYAEAWLRDLDIRHPQLADLIGHGSLWCLGRDLNVAAQRSASGDARVSVMVRVIPGTRPRLRPGAGRADLLALLEGWSTRITALIANADEQVTVRSLTTLPSECTWQPRADATLIGDAAHVMPPVGEGANQAMLDAAELGRSLLDAQHGPAAALHHAEQAMWARVRPIAEESARCKASSYPPPHSKT